jgi:tetratricopeptide (TPR) repeat protein
MKTDKLLHKTKFGILLSLLSVSAAQAEEGQLDGYVMTVYSNVAHGSAILDGKSDKVVEKLVRRSERSDRSLASHINLCVAYAKMKQLDKATRACDSAIAVSVNEADRLERLDTFGRRTTMVADTGRAIALTNRGVLHAITGESDEARAMFEMAMQLESTEESAQLNLTRLDERKRTGDS